MHLFTNNVNTAFRQLVALFAERWEDGPVPLPCRVRARERASRNGRVKVIDEPVTVTYLHPTQRVLFNSARDANPFFHLYESLWMLAGRNDLAPLSRYVGRMKSFSDDGATLNGAYGYRWRKVLNRRTAEPKWIDQLDVIVSHLKADPDSRRAVLSMWNVEDDLMKIGLTCPRCGGYGCYVCEDPTAEVDDAGNCNQYPGAGHYNESKDVCCNLSVCFSIVEREELGSSYIPRLERQLDMTVFNRSNDLVWGMLGCDYTTFSFLQEYVAARLGAVVGRYHQVTNNLHAYIDRPDWRPDAWLDAKKDEEDTYEDSSTKTIPLVRDPAQFEKELPLIVEQYSGKEPMEEPFREYTEPFLAQVAQPMLDAHLAYKKGTNNAMYRARQIVADDWRKVSVDWLGRRVKK